MSKFGPEFSPNDAPALPHWIGGHAYLTMAPSFFDVKAADGRVLRRVPLCGESEADMAVGDGAQGVQRWRAMADGERAAAFEVLCSLFERFAAHLAKLVAEESGGDAQGAADELARVRNALDAAIPGMPPSDGGVVAVIAEASEPLAAPLACALAAIQAGHAVVLKPSVRVPSALFAVGEVFSRAGFPGGMVNILQGDEAAVRALAAHPSITAVACPGEGGVARLVGELAGQVGKPVATGRGDALMGAWQQVLGAQR